MGEKAVDEEAQALTGEPDRDSGPKEWDPVDEAMAMMLAEGLTYAAVAEVLEVTTKTVQRRMRKDWFRNRVMELRRERLSTITSKLVALSDSALDVIREVMDSEDERLRFRAAEKVLVLGRRLHSEEAMESELRVRVEEIHRLLDDRGRGQA